MRFQRILIACSVCFITALSTQVIAQDKTAEGASQKKTTKTGKKLLAPDAMTYSVGLTAGSQGLGLDFILRINNHFSARLGGSYLPNASYTMKDMKMGQINTNVEVSARNFVNFHTYFDYSPFKSSGFRLTAGWALTQESTADALVIPQGTYMYNDYPLTSDQVGTGAAKLTWESGLAPYLGAGWLFGARKDTKFHASFDIGTYYLSAPYAGVSGTKLLSGNSSNTEQFVANTREYRWWPVLQLGLQYRL
jgi:hypothetical protein